MHSAWDEKDFYFFLMKNFWDKGSAERTDECHCKAML